MGRESVAADLRDERIVGVAEAGGIAGLAVTARIDEGLGMLDAEADLEGLGLDAEPFAGEGRDRVAGAVAEGEKDGIARQLISG